MLRDHTLVNQCCMCCGDGESIDHLLLHCPVTHSLWSFMLHRLLVCIGLCQERRQVCYLASINGLNSTT